MLSGVVLFVEVRSLDKEIVLHDKCDWECEDALRFFFFFFCNCDFDKEEDLEDVTNDLDLDDLDLDMNGLDFDEV